MTEGFWTVLVEGVPPGKDHDQLVGEPVDVLVKVTVEPAVILSGLAVKLAVGSEVTLIVLFAVAEAHPVPKSVVSLKVTEPE